MSEAFRDIAAMDVRLIQIQANKQLRTCKEI